MKVNSRSSCKTLIQFSLAISQKSPIMKPYTYIVHKIYIVYKIYNDCTVHTNTVLYCILFKKNTALSELHHYDNLPKSKIYKY